MKLFLDTSNKKFILAIINEDNIIVDFLMRKSNNDMVKNTLPLIKKFLDKNNLEINNINEYMITTGPGSFTGVKVAINIVRSINLINPIKKIHTISTFDLLSNKNTKYTAIRFGKNKYYLNKKRKTNIVDNLIGIDADEITMDYDDFNKNKLQEKINNKSFKVLDNINKVKIKYLTNFK